MRQPITDEIVFAKGVPKLTKKSSTPVKRGNRGKILEAG
jgi:hypothetical protein